MGRHERTPLVLADARGDSRLKNRDWFIAQGFMSFLGVPIMLDGAAIGVLAGMARARHEFTEAEVALAQSLTAPAAAAVRNAALYAEALERVDEIQAFQRVSAETLSAPASETALRVVVREMRHLLRSDAALCSLIDSTGRMRTVTSLGARGHGIKGYSPAAGGGLAGIVLHDQSVMRSDDYLSDARFERPPEVEAWARREGVNALIVAPVVDPSGDVIAFLCAYNRTAARFTARHEATVRGLAQQAALAIGKARAFEEERQRAEQTSALLDIARACTSTLEFGPLLSEVVRRSALALGAERAAIFLWRGEHLVPVSAQFADGHPDPALWEAFKAMFEQQHVEDIRAHAEAIQSRRPVAVEPGSGRLPAEWFERFGIRSALIVPLVFKDRVLGTLGLDATNRSTWKQGQVDLAMTIAAQVALAVDNARHYQDARQRAAEFETLAAIGETLTSTLDGHKVLEAIADSAATLIGAQRAVVFALDDGCLRARTVRGGGIESGFTVKLGQGAAGEAALRLAPVWCDDVLERPLPSFAERHEPTGLPLHAVIAEHGYRAVLAAPVISRETALGAVCVYWDKVHRPDEREIRMLSALGRQAAIAMDNAQLVGDLRRTLEDLRSAQETLVRGATLRAVGELAAGAAHHLNNLMAVVLGRTQLLLMKNPGTVMATSLKSIERAAIDAADTVRRIQGFSGTAKEGGEAVARFDLNAVVQEAIEFTRSRWGNEAKVRGASIDVQAQPGPVPALSGRRLEIREVITNLLLNAVDALPEGGRIVVSTRTEAGRAVIAVSDSGTGMPPDVKRRAFEPFFTTKGVKRTGLGLAVAYGTVQRHGGQISIDSEPGAGTTVTFWLPAPVEEAVAAARPAPARGQRFRSVLVIDDEADVRDLVSDVLASHGHHITGASGGREGLARFEAGTYDIVLTDLGMPDLNGWEVARAIKSARSDTPVLLLTGWADAVDPSAAGLVDAILKKPFGLDELAAAVTTALADR